MNFIFIADVFRILELGPPSRSYRSCYLESIMVGLGHKFETNYFYTVGNPQHPQGVNYSRRKECPAEA